MSLRDPDRVLCVADFCPRTGDSIPPDDTTAPPDDPGIPRSAEAGPRRAALASDTMRVPNNRVATRRSAAVAARTTLTSLIAAVGTAGLAAAHANPGLLAEVDQHAAGVRETLDGDRRPLTVAALAGYAEGLRDAAAEHGWTPPAEPDWSAPDWTLTRLLAVCLLTRGLDPRHLA